MQRANDVVSFVLTAAEMRNAQVFAKLAAPTELQLEIRRRRLPIGFIGRIDAVAERGFETLVEGDGEVAGLGALDQIAEKPRETEQRMGSVPLAVKHVGRHRIVGAEYID